MVIPIFPAKSCPKYELSVTWEDISGFSTVKVATKYLVDDSRAKEVMCQIWIRGDHIYEKLNSLSFPGDFQDIFKFFPEQLKREIFNGVHLCFWSHHMLFIFPEFSRFFFLKKFKFSWDFDNFSNSLSFLGFPYFPGLWPPCHNSIWFGQRNYKVTCISCISRWHILLWLWLKS